MTVAGIIGIDGMFLGLCTHISSQFEIIGSRIRTVIEENISKHEIFHIVIVFVIASIFQAESHETIAVFTSEQNDLLYKELTKIIQDHEDTIRICQKMSESLSMNVLLHCISSALITGICCLMILLAKGADKLIFVNYIIASTTQVFMYSLGGNFLEDSSTAIQQAAYDFHWYKCDVKIRKLILMIMVRAQRKTAVDVPFFKVSLETFASVRLKLRLMV